MIHNRYRCGSCSRFPTQFTNEKKIHYSYTDPDANMRPKRCRRSCPSINGADALHNFHALFLWNMNHSSKRSSVIAISSPEIRTHAWASATVDCLLNCLCWAVTNGIARVGHLLRFAVSKQPFRTIIRAFLLFIPSTSFKSCSHSIHLYSLLNLSMYPIVLIP